MSVGETITLFCPAELAYGEHGIGGVIPPNSDLEYEITLLKIEGRDKTNVPPKEEL